MSSNARRDRGGECGVAAFIRMRGRSTLGGGGMGRGREGVEGMKEGNRREAFVAMCSVIGPSIELFVEGLGKEDMLWAR